MEIGDQSGNGRGAGLERLRDELVLANHILAEQGVVDGFGHISVRHPDAADEYLLSRSLAPASVTRDDVLTFDLNGDEVGSSGHRVYLERFIHSEIYRARPDVISVVHSHSPAVIPFGVTPVSLQPIFHMSGFLGGGVPVFDSRLVAGDTDLLIRDSALGASLAEVLGDGCVALQRGHGSVIVGRSIREAVFRAVYLEVNARLQIDAHRLGPITFLSPGEAALAGEALAAQIDRAWDMWARSLAAARPGHAMDEPVTG